MQGNLNNNNNRERNKIENLTNFVKVRPQKIVPLKMIFAVLGKQKLADFFDEREQDGDGRGGVRMMMIMVMFMTVKMVMMVGDLHGVGDAGGARSGLEAMCLTPSSPLGQSHEL